jgi:hypothetical protein
VKSEEEIKSKLRDRLHRAQRKYFSRFKGRPKQELYEEFQARMHDPAVLLREYKDVTTLLWVLGEFDRGRGDDGEGSLGGEVVPRCSGADPEGQGPLRGGGEALG